MKILLEKWRSHVSESKIHKRIVVNELVELTEEELREFPLSSEELEKIKRWAGFQEDPLFLGSGTMGVAYQFGGDVLKITSDANEFAAVKKIAGKSHPNVYRVKKAIRRFLPSDEKPTEAPRRPFLIVYELVGSSPGDLDLPTPKQQDIIRTINAYPRPEHYDWIDNLGEVKSSFANFVQQNPAQVEENQIPKFKSHEEKLDSLIQASGLQGNEAVCLKAAWKISVGFYGAKNINSVEGVISALKDSGFNYVDDLSSGLTFLKKEGRILFRDLKTTNVINDNGRLIIIDVGKARELDRPTMVSPEKQMKDLQRIFSQR
jgi:hypothetical protein